MGECVSGLPWVSVCLDFHGGVSDYTSMGEYLCL